MRPADDLEGLSEVTEEDKDFLDLLEKMAEEVDTEAHNSN